MPGRRKPHRIVLQDATGVLILLEYAINGGEAAVWKSK
jgi:hypothetical protein